MENQIQIQTQTGVTDTVKVDLNNLQDFNIQNYEAKIIDLDIEYWTPEKEGESQTLIFSQIVEKDPIPDFNDKDKIVEKDCAYFLKQTQVEGKTIYKAVRCAASRLVSSLKRFGVEGNVYHITYTGKEKNKTNNFLSSKFAIQPVMIVQPTARPL